MTRPKRERQQKGRHDDPFKRVHEFAPRNLKQAEYIRVLEDKEIVIAYGPAGTGKSAVPTMIGLQKLIRGEITKLIFTRPIVELHSDESKGLGFLKGGLREKTEPYLRPVMEIMKQWVNEAQIIQLMNYKKIECVPLEFIRGNTFNDCFVLLDEAQNASYKQIKSLLTRIGENCTLVLNGDVEQHDMRGEVALDIWRQNLSFTDFVGIIQFTEDEIVRNKLIRRILDVDRKYQEGKKNVRNSAGDGAKCSQCGRCSSEETAPPGL